jgi:hypothetical protein
LKKTMAKIVRIGEGETFPTNRAEDSMGVDSLGILEWQIVVVV